MPRPPVAAEARVTCFAKRGPDRRPAGRPKRGGGMEIVLPWPGRSADRFQVSRGGGLVPTKDQPGAALSGFQKGGVRSPTRRSSQRASRGSVPPRAWRSVIAPPQSVAITPSDKRIEHDGRGAPSPPRSASVVDSTRCAWQRSAPADGDVPEMISRLGVHSDFLGKCWSRITARAAPERGWSWTSP